MPDIESQWGIVFRDYFAAELKRLKEMELDGLVKVDNRSIEVMPKGRLLIRNICMSFDAYINSKAAQGSFSKVI